jgi:hypothetical protein
MAAAEVRAVRARAPEAERDAAAIATLLGVPGR